MAQHMNSGIMTAHVLTLVLQLMSLVLYYWMFFYVNRYPMDLRLQIWGLRAWDISVIVNFLSQLFLCVLFWKLGTKRQHRPE
jgi:hypothetical protein